MGSRNRQFLSFAKERAPPRFKSRSARRTKPIATASLPQKKRLMHIEGIILPPADDKAGLDRFAAEIATAKACGCKPSFAP